MGQGHGEDNFCQLYPIAGTKAQPRREGPGLRTSSWPVVWPERNMQLQAMMKYLGAHIPRM